MNGAFTATPSGAGEVVGLSSFLMLHYRIALENDVDIVTTFDDGPVVLLLDQGQIAPILEQALFGIREGKHTTFHLAPKHTFGPHNLELLRRASLATLCENSSFEEDYQPGDLVEFSVSSGGKYASVLKEVGETSALFNFNYLLVGQTVVLEAQLIGIL